MLLLISGSRQTNTKDTIILQHYLDKLHQQTPVTLIIHGGAQGVDTFAALWATLNEIPQQIHKPNYKLGKAAPMIRNRQMVRNAQKVICYYAANYPSVTAGTNATAKMAKQQSKLHAELWRDFVREAHNKQGGIQGEALTLL